MTTLKYRNINVSCVYSFWWTPSPKVTYICKHRSGVCILQGFNWPPNRLNRVKQEQTRPLFSHKVDLNTTHRQRSIIFWCFNVSNPLAETLSGFTDPSCPQFLHTLGFSTVAAADSDAGFAGAKSRPNKSKEPSCLRDVGCSLQAAWKEPPKWLHLCTSIPQYI